MSSEIISKKESIVKSNFMSFCSEEMEVEFEDEDNDNDQINNDN